jgi:hypothetical protein
MIHQGVNGGHLGRERTQRNVQARAYWPGWSEDIKRTLKCCAPCAQYYHGHAPKQIPLKPFMAGEPWEVVPIDITGPHPKSRKGHSIYLLFKIISGTLRELWAFFTTAEMTS